MAKERKRQTYIIVHTTQHIKIKTKQHEHHKKRINLSMKKVINILLLSAKVGVARSKLFYERVESYFQVDALFCKCLDQCWISVIPSKVVKIGNVALSMSMM